MQSLRKIAAIADVHGYAGKLDYLMGNLANEIDFSQDVVVFLGDYVDGGKNTKGVIERLMSYQVQYPHWQFLFGNHEDLMLDAILGNCAIYGSYDLWYNQGGKETLYSYSANKINALSLIPVEHIEWIKSLPLTYETESYIFVHAGLEPKKSPETTSRQNLLWIRDEFLDSDYDWGKLVVAGHTYHPSPIVKSNLIDLDCVHHGGGKLHALILPERVDNDNPLDLRFVTE